MPAEVRQPAVAGLFYPADSIELRRTVEDLLAGVEPAGSTADDRSLEAVIAPHAGYAYSGPVAAYAHAEVARAARRVRRVVLLGPAHRWGFRGIALPGATALATPLGIVPVDAEAAALASTLRSVLTLPQAHDDEHGLEVHLPFLQVVLGDFTVVPLVVGDVDAADVAAVLESLWGGPETLVVVSSDLSHFLSYERACEVDRETAGAIEALEPDAIGFEHACGRTPVAGLLRIARERGLRAGRLDLRNSGDTAGGRDRVVGYGAWAFNPGTGSGLGSAPASVIEPS